MVNMRDTHTYIEDQPVVQLQESQNAIEATKNNTFKNHEFTPKKHLKIAKFTQNCL